MQNYKQDNKYKDQNGWNPISSKKDSLHLMPIISPKISSLYYDFTANKTNSCE